MYLGWDYLLFETEIRDVTDCLFRGVELGGGMLSPLYINDYLYFLLFS